MPDMNSILRAQAEQPLCHTLWLCGREQDADQLYPDIGLS